MESALPRTLFVSRRWLAAVGVVAVALVAGVVLYAVSQNPGRQAPPVGLTTPSAAAPAVIGFVRESAGNTKNATSGWDRMQHVQLVVIGTTAQGVALVHHLRAGAQGQFRLNLPNGHYRIYAIAYGPASAPLARQPHSTVTVTGGRPVHVRITATTL
jgi:hypothetical protein